jgi:hypothetical protein
MMLMFLFCFFWGWGFFRVDGQKIGPLDFTKRRSQKK